MSHTKRSTAHLSTAWQKRSATWAFLMDCSSKVSAVKLAYERGHLQVYRSGVGKCAGNRAVTDSNDGVAGNTRWAKRAQAKMVRRNAKCVIREQREG